MRALQDAWRITGDAGRRMRVLKPSPEASRVLELTGRLGLVA